MSYSLKRKKPATTASAQEFEFSSSDEDSQQNTHFIKNNEIENLTSLDDIEHVDLPHKEIINNNIEEVCRPDFSLNSSLIINTTTQFVNNTSINHQSKVRINDSSLQTSLLNSNLSMVKNEDMAIKNNDRILDDLKGRGDLENKSHSILLKNRKRRYVVSKKRKIEEDDRKSSESESNDDLLDISDTFDIKKEKEEDDQVVRPVSLSGNKYKSQKAVLSEILDQNEETKNLDHRQREIVLFSLGQAKDELLLKKSDSEDINNDNESDKDIEIGTKKGNIDFIKYKEDFDGFVHSEDIAKDVKEFVQMLEEDKEFCSFIEVYEKFAVEEYIGRLKEVLSMDDSSLKYLISLFITD